MKEEDEEEKEREEEEEEGQETPREEEKLIRKRGGGVFSPQFYLTIFSTGWISLSLSLSLIVDMKETMNVSPDKYDEDE